MAPASELPNQTKVEDTQAQAALAHSLQQMSLGGAGHSMDGASGAHCTSLAPAEAPQRVEAVGGRAVGWRWGAVEQLVVYGLGSVEDSVTSRCPVRGPSPYLTGCVGCRGIPALTVASVVVPGQVPAGVCATAEGPPAGPARACSGVRPCLHRGGPRPARVPGRPGLHQRASCCACLPVDSCTAITACSQSCLVQRSDGSIAVTHLLTRACAGCPQLAV